uniref:Forkhead box protein N3 isoform X4 n=1 Tax=Pogona vitticeps TaxID=103695 RepID=A0ABM5FB68_9SAUR
MDLGPGLREEGGLWPSRGLCGASALSNSGQPLPLSSESEPSAPPLFSSFPGSGAKIKVQRVLLGCLQGNFLKNQPQQNNKTTYGEETALEAVADCRFLSIGKGSLWCIDPEYRQNLIQALKKTPYHPYSHVFSTPPASPQAYQSTSGPPIWPGSTFFKRNGALLQDPDIDAATAMMLLNTPPEIQAGFPPGVIQNGARILSRGIFPGVRPLPINPIGSMAAAVRNGIANCRMRTDSEQSCDSPVVSGDPKEDHNYSSAKSSNHRSTSPTSDSISSSSADDHYEFATKGSRDSSEGSEVSVHSHESHSEAEEEDKRQNRKETKDSLADSGYASQHKKRQHLLKARKVPSDTLPLKKRRTEKPPESDDEEMKEAAGSLLHLAGIRSCLNNITNRTAKGQKEQKDTTKNENKSID